MKPIKVLVVDDSTVVRGVLTRLFQKAGLDVVGAARDPFEARDLIVKLEPDVLTLDLEMPRMDGLTFLEKLMEYHPMPVVVLSGVTTAHGEKALKALELGAVAVVEKPSGESNRETSRTIFDHLVEVVQTTARAKPRPRKEEFRTSPAKKSQVHPPSDRLAALGASLGGTEALQEVLSGLPMDHPGLVIVQHMPAEFTSAFAHRLDQNSNLTVKEAKDGDLVLDGQALIAPGGLHLSVERKGKGFRVRCQDGPAVHHVKPSVDILFQSVARAAGSRAVGVLLTGMGRDGAEGLLAMRQAGAATLAQDQASCVVYGMPKEAVERGAVERIVNLSEMAKVIPQEMKKISSTSV